MHFFEDKTGKSKVFPEYRSGCMYVIQIGHDAVVSGRTNTDSKWPYTGVCMQRGRKELEEDLLCA